MRSARLACFPLAALLFIAVATGCENDSDGPLKLMGGGMIADPVANGVWFRVLGCAGGREDPIDLMVTKVTTSPRDSHVDTRVAWYDDSAVVRAKPGEPSAVYHPVTATSHLGGTLEGCSLNVAVVLSPSKTDPVTARSVTVSYQVDGKAYSVQTDLDAVLCPAGTHSRESSCSKRRTGSH